MAVQFSHGFSLAKLFGVSPALLQKAQELGVQIVHSSAGNMSVLTANGDNCGNIPIKAQAITLAKADKMGPASKDAIRYQIDKAVNSAIAESAKILSQPMMLKMESTIGVDLAGPDADMTHVSKLLLKPKSYPKANMSPAEKAAWTKKQMKEANAELPKPLGQLLKEKLDKHGEDTVPLAQATSLYQTVYGTSQKSYYYVMALLNGAAIAVKKDGDNLAVRVEGSSLTAYQSALESMGFTFKGNSKQGHPYASVHLECPGVLKDRALGAIIGAVGFENLKSAGSLAKVPG